MRIRYILLAVLVLFFAHFAVAKENSKARRARQKLEKALKKHAGYFALVRSEIGQVRGEGDVGRGSPASGGTRRSGGTKTRPREYQYYPGFLTPPKDKAFYVVTAAERLAPDEEFVRVKIFFISHPKKEIPAEYVGRHESSGVVVFRILKPRRLRIMMLSPPVTSEKAKPGELVMSLAHPWSSEKNRFVFWQFAFGKVSDPPFFTLGEEYGEKANLGPLVAHWSVPLVGRYVYWYGSPVLRKMLDDKGHISGFEILGMNIMRYRKDPAPGLNKVFLALPYKKVLVIRDEVITKAKAEAEARDHEKREKKRH